MEKLTLLPYTPDWESRWDRFVAETAVNGTFLQSRRFLNYHPQGRFEDASVLVLRGNELAAVVPAAAGLVDGKRLLRSHPGSTFGGPVVCEELWRAQRLIELVGALEEYWRGAFDGVEYKITPDLFTTLPSDALQYALYHQGYRDELEVSAYVELAGRSAEELRAAYSFNKRYDVKRCEKAGLVCAPLVTDDDVQAFYELLCLNLQKFDAKPVHTLPELLDFKNERLKEEVSFLGVRDPEGALVGAACLFSFAQTNTLHTQYLATAPNVRAYAPSSFLYDSVLREGLTRGYRRVSLGTATHNRGRVLNEGLIQNKEGYGSLHTVNRIYTKIFGAETEANKP